MKKFMIAAALFVAVSASAFTAPSSEEKASVSLFAKFKSASNVVWTKHKNLQHATFLNNGEWLHAFFNEDSELVATARNIEIDQMNITAGNALKEKYAIDHMVYIHEYTSDSQTWYIVCVEQNGQYQDVKVTEEGIVKVQKSKKK